MPLESRWTHTEHGRLHARVGGGRAKGGVPVVLVHGLGVSSRYMVPTAEVLASERRVLAVDLPGFGLSAKPERVLGVPELARALAAFIQAERLEPAVLLANSFGCQVAVELAANRPDLVTSLVLLAPTVDPEARTVGKQAARWMLTWPFEPPSLTPVVLRDYRDAGIERVRATGHVALEDPIEAKLPLVGAPAIVVRGDRDRVVPLRWAQRAASLLPRARLHLIPGGAHCLNFGMPGDVAAVVAAFAPNASSSSGGFGSEK